jgi:hypothetical protein
MWPLSQRTLSVIFLGEECETLRKCRNVQVQKVYKSAEICKKCENVQLCAKCAKSAELFGDAPGVNIFLTKQPNSY